MSSVPTASVTALPLSSPFPVIVIVDALMTDEESELDVEFDPPTDAGVGAVDAAETPALDADGVLGVRSPPPPVMTSMR